jgi:hypothetical protein
LDVPPFLLVESRVCPTGAEGFKKGLGDDETFETEFIGASEEDCQRWVQENTRNFIVADLIAIADARTAKDGTILIQPYQQEFPPELEDLEMDGHYSANFHRETRATPGGASELKSKMHPRPSLIWGNLESLKPIFPIMDTKQTY